MTARLMIINGPNLNLLGVREPHIYGSTTLSAIKESCEQFAKCASAQLSFHQSNHEGSPDRSHSNCARRGRCNHYQPGGLLIHLYRNVRRTQNLSRPDHRGAHFQYPRPRRIASSFETVIRCQSGCLRSRTLWLHSRHAGDAGTCWKNASSLRTRSSVEPTIRSRVPL